VIAMRAAVLLAMLAPICCAAQDAVHVTLQPRATVAGPRLALGDVARIEAPAEVSSQLAAVALARAPLPGYSKHLSQAEVRRMVRAQAPQIEPHIRWDGAKAVDVALASNALDAARIEQVALEQVRAALGKRFDAVTVELAEPVAALELPRGEVVMQVRPLAEGAVRARELAWVDVYVDRAFQRAVAVPLRIAAFAQVRVARTDLAEGRELRAADFETRRVDVARLGEEPAPRDAADRRLRRGVRQGAVLMAADLEARPAVARGELVTLRLDSPMVHIETRAVALSDAAVGQPLWVRREAGGESLRARVVSPGNVEVASP